MKRPIFTETAINQQRIKKIETVVTRLVRRSSQVASALVTPYPISNVVVSDNVRGPILRYIFPCKGKITTGFIRLDQKPKNVIEVEIRLFNEFHAESTKIMLNNKLYNVQSNLEVQPGDCLEVIFNPAESDIIKEVWASILWVPNARVVDVQNFLIDELEKVIDNFNAEE